MIILKKGVILTLITVFIAVLAIFFPYLSVIADTPYQDVDIEMGIEIGDDSLDFNDAKKTVEKGRFIKYQIKITNSDNSSYNDLLLFMNIPEYMEYVPNSTVIQNENFSYYSSIPDVNGYSPLEIGYNIIALSVGEELIIELQFQITISEENIDDPLYTVAWVSIFGKHSAVPILSKAIETTISGDAKPIVQAAIEALPGLDGKVNPGMQITYNYKLHNVGGLSASNLVFTTYLPEGTTCIEGCGSFTIDTLQPNEEKLSHTMIVVVNSDLSGITEIVNIGYDLSGDGFEKIKNRDAIIHSITGGSDNEQDIGEFTLIINQVPNIILNSADGISPRPDGADLTETQYSLLYGGRGQQYTYPNISNAGQSSTYTPCQTYVHPNKFGAYFYAYNSGGNQNSESFSGIGLVSSPIEFSVNTVLPEVSPKLEFTVNASVYNFGSTSEVNKYMKEGNQIDVPSIFTESRAVQNGAMGIVSSEVNANVIEDIWQYKYAGTKYLCTYYYSCGEDTCSRSYNRPVYTWRKIRSSNVKLKDDDNTHVSVYTSTAWLKTQGGHIGTNGSFTNEAGKFGNLDINLVDLISYQNINNEEDGYARLNPYIRENHPTPSSEYTPPGEFNAEYLVFGNTGVGDMKTSCGQSGEANCDAWYVTDFIPFKNENENTSFIQKGSVYDRTDNPRNYEEDLLIKEKFSEVKTNELSSYITGTVKLGDDIVWNNTGDIIIGGDEDDDVVVFSGGQSRIYTTGNVYIKADIKYETSSSSNYNEITSVRIDAQNIYVDGEVEDLEVMLLAREGFYSGVSKKQLRILGDVIAKNTFWQREPLLEYDVEEINKPSEYIIEDMRKYIVPPPGDTELPDNYTIWRQVNPATGEVLDSY